MIDSDRLERQGDFQGQIATLERDAARLARTHRAQVRLFNENFAQSRAYWLAVLQARQGPSGQGRSDHPWPGES